MYECQVKVEVRDRIANGYLRGTTYLRTPFFAIILIVTLCVVRAEAVIPLISVLLQFGRKQRNAAQPSQLSVAPE